MSDLTSSLNLDPKTHYFQPAIFPGCTVPGLAGAEATCTGTFETEEVKGSSCVLSHVRFLICQGFCQGVVGASEMTCPSLLPWTSPGGTDDAGIHPCFNYCWCILGFSLALKLPLRSTVMGLPLLHFILLGLCLPL